MTVTEMACSVPGCGRPVLARGWCRAHYYRWRLHGDPTAGKRPAGMSLEEVFRWFMPEDPPAEGCWLWRGTYRSDRGGYGTFQMKGRNISAHVASYQVFYGVDPKGTFVLHECNNPPCVNPAHLRLGTNAENMRDMVEAGRSLSGSSCPNSKLVESDVIEARRLYATGDYTYPELAERYGVATVTMSRAIRGITWRHI